MDKIAIFVEGQTELIFTERLLSEIAGRRNIQIVTRQVIGGTTTPKKYIFVGHSQNGKREFYALITDCSSYNRVTSEIRDNYKGLVAGGYKAILGIRDVHPNDRADIPKIRAYSNVVLEHKPIDPLIILATMEVEAWFIAEHTHFERIDTGLTAAFILARLGIDVVNGNAEARPIPSEDLRSIYRLVGKGYTKSKRHAQRTVGKLDYARIYLELPHRAPSIHPLIQAVDKYLTHE